MTLSVPSRRAPRLGATVLPSGTRFALWSTTATRAAVRLFEAADRPLRTEPLEARGEGIFESTLPDIGAGALYKFVLDDRELPDPYARFLPFGVHGPARVEQARAAPPVGTWTPPPFESWVIYELHVGCFTPEGTWDAARQKLDALVELGVNAIEVMPIAAFDGARGWGYDGVALFAPFAAYGEPTALRGFIEACHERRLAVLLDVVYNHFGPAGNYLGAYSPEYFTSRHVTAWGSAPDYGEAHLRRLVLDNVRYWLGEFDFDGLRLDATHAIADDSRPHILSEAASVTAEFGARRILIAEDERNEPALVLSNGVRAIWADDFHHVIHVLLTRERDGYYSAYEPSASVLARTINSGWLFEGQLYPPWSAPRGKPALGLAASSFVYCIQNHDQIGNRPLGSRLNHDAGLDAFGAASMLLLFLPMVPLIFMGQEWGASTPFLYFTDHDGELGEAIAPGRRAEFQHFGAFADATANIPDPQAESTFAASQLRWDERERGAHAALLSSYRRMLALRANDPVLSRPSRTRTEASCRGDLLMVRRWAGPDERVLLWNTGSAPAAAPFTVRDADVMMVSGRFSYGEALPPQAAVLLRRAR